MVMWSGTSGLPMAPSRMASCFVQRVPAVFGHHAAVLLVVLRVPGQAVPVDRGAVAADGGVGDADGLVDDFRTDAVAADDCDTK